MKRFAPLIIFALFCLMLIQFIANKENNVAVSARIGQTLPAIELKNTSLQSLLTAPHTIINVFASWCLPCGVEHPLLLSLKEKNLAPIIGIAWKDKPEKISAWLEKRGSPYRYLLHDEQGKSTIALGISGVPETFVVNQEGTILFHSSAPLSIDDIQKIEELVSP